MTIPPISEGAFRQLFYAWSWRIILLFGFGLTLLVAFRAEIVILIVFAVVEFTIRNLYAGGAAILACQLKIFEAPRLQKKLLEAPFKLHQLHPMRAYLLTEKGKKRTEHIAIMDDDTGKLLSAIAKELGKTPEEALHYVIKTVFERQVKGLLRISRPML